DSLYRADSGYRRMSITAAGATKFAHRGLTYAAGHVVAACLDGEIRGGAAERSSLDDVMRSVFSRFTMANRYDTKALVALTSEVAKTDLTQWFARYVEGTEGLPASACGAAEPH